MKEEEENELVYLNHFIALVFMKNKEGASDRRLSIAISHINRC